LRSIVMSVSVCLSPEPHARSLPILCMLPIAGKGFSSRLTMQYNALAAKGSFRGFRAQRFYLNLLPVLEFLHHSTDLDEPDKPVTSVFLISQHRKSYKPSKNGAICASVYLLCAQRFYRSAVFDRTFVQALIALFVADRSGTKVLCANFIANLILHRAQRFYQAR